MNFLHSYWLWALLILLPGLWLLFRTGDLRRKRLLREWLGGGAEQTLSCGRRALRRRLLAGAILFFALGAARPWWGEHLIDIPVAGSDVLVVFDVSRSMLAQDVAPSRLEHAKWLLRELVRQNPGDRFGIIAFAGRAFLSCPLTSDRVSLDQCIDELSPELVPVGGTNLAEALQTALTALRAAAGQHRTILLMTDGEELTGSVSDLLAELKKQDVELLVAGFGDPAVPALIPESGTDGHSFKRDSSGELVRTRLNEALLKELAAATGGIYCTSTALHSGLEPLNRRLRALESGGRHEVRRTIPIDRFMIFLGAGAVLLALWFLIGEAPGGARRHSLLLWLAVFGICSAMSPARGDDGSAPATSSVPAALPAETEAVRPAKDPVTLYNEARTLQLDGKGAEAEQAYEEALAGGSAGAEREASMHNLGILSHQAARDTANQSLQIARSGDLGQALRELEKAGQNLAKAEAWYMDALAGPDRPELRRTALAQQMLLKDREHFEQLKKMLEELKKKQEKARQKTQQAARQNQQQNQQNQQQQNQQQQNQQQQNQQQQQGQQDQQKQDQQQGQQDQQQQGRQNGSNDPARQALDDARDAVDQMRQAADRAGQREMSEQAEQARKELDQAAEKQQKQDYSGAQKHLDAAQQALGADHSGEKGQDKQEKSGDGKDGQEGRTDKKSQEGKDGSAGDKSEETKDGQAGKNGKDGKEDKPLPVMPEEGKQSEQKMDRRQADALLDLMSRDEQQLRDAVKQHRNRAVRPVEKDW